MAFENGQTGLFDAYDITSEITTVPAPTTATGDIYTEGVIVRGLNTLFTQEFQNGGWIFLPSKGELRQIETVFSDIRMDLCEAFSTDQVALPEITDVTFVGDSGVKELATITLPTTAGAAQADYFVFSTYDGVTFAIWLDIDAAGTPPTGAAFLAATHTIEVDINSVSGTAIDNAAALWAAVQNDSNWLVEGAGKVTMIDNLDGTVDFNHLIAGTAADPVPHDAIDSTPGSIGVAVGTQGVDPTLAGKYWSIVSPVTLTAPYAVWYNCTDGDDSLNVDPTPGGNISLRIDYPAGASASDIATLTAAAMTLTDDFSVPVPGAAIATITNIFPGAVPDAVDVDAGVTPSVTQQGTDPVTFDSVASNTYRSVGLSVTGAGNATIGGSVKAPGTSVMPSEDAGLAPILIDATSTTVAVDSLT